MEKKDYVVNLYFKEKMISGGYKVKEQMMQYGD